MGMSSSTRPVPEDYCPPAIADVVAKQQRKQKPKAMGVDDFPIYADDPLRDSHLLLDKYLRDAAALAAPAAAAGAAGAKANKVEFRRLAEGAILTTAGNRWPNHLRAIVARLMFRWTHCVTPGEKFGSLRMWRYDFGEHLLPLGAMAAELLRRVGSHLSDDDFAFLVAARAGDDHGARDVRGYFPIDGLIEASRAIRDSRGLSPAVRSALADLRAECTNDTGWGNREDKARVRAIDELLEQLPPERQELLERGEPWAEAVLDFLDRASAPAAQKWRALFEHCERAEPSKPTGKWMKEAKQRIDAIGAADFLAAAAGWLALAARQRTRPLTDDQVVMQWKSQFDLYSLNNAPILKGFAWACGAADEPKLAGPLGQLAEWCYTKIRNHGPRSPKVGNGCLCALIAMSGQEARAELSRLKAKVKQPTAKKMIEKAIGASAAAAGMTPEDLEELAVAGYGLSEVGRGERKVGTYTVETRITGTTKVELTFTDAKGKSRASVPAELKADDAVKEIQQNAKVLAKMLPALRDRLERLPMNRRELPLAAWRTRYLDHPVVGTLARRLIWEFVPNPKKPDDSIAAMWLDGKLVDASDDKVRKLDDEKTLVRLWHPSAWPPGNVLGWRNFLERHQVTQPFKQAHREVYLLTDAERRTGTYSNRFATHILRQHQFAALCTQRGWRYRLIGSWDGGGDNTPTLALPKWNLEAQLWVDAGGDAAGEVGPTGVATYVTTDQVRFYNAADAKKAPMKLEDVPPLAFSEVMRDVDLFVGVTSMGNDPQALPANHNHHGYWTRFSFDDLSETAKTRRAVLERLIPRLTIAARASLTEKFLVIQGDLRTYKIHLGSGNILMKPNDQYLCIVPDRDLTAARDQNLFLPFEGDHTLSVILSKAFLLADDAKITDETITRQIAIPKAAR
jgi:hypothetical protein